MEQLAPFVALGVVALVFSMFVWERYPPDVVAVGGVALLLATGVLHTESMLLVLANSAPLTIAAMFVLSAALVRTGLLELLIRAARTGAADRPDLVIPAVLAATMVASAFINNTPVVMVLIPVLLALGRDLDQTPSRLLIPLSYAAILGGSCTLIGTSTNLLVDGVARSEGLAPFHLFEIAPVGLAVALAGGAFLWFAAPRLLPDRQALHGLFDEPARQLYLTEALINEGSPLVGRRLDQIDSLKGRDVQIIDVVRNDYSKRPELAEISLRAQDRLVLQSSARDIMGLKSENGLLLGSGVSAVGERSAIVIEALVAPRSRLVGRRLRAMRLRRRYGLYVLAIHRHGEDLLGRIADTTIESGDTLLVEGNPDDMRRFADEMSLVNLVEPDFQPTRRDKAWIAGATLAGVVVLAAFGVMPIAGLAVIGVGIVLLSRCLDAEDAFEAIDWRLLVLILAMLAIGRSIVDTGAADLLVDAGLPHLHGLAPHTVLLFVYAVVAAATAVLTNNAVAVIATPIVIALAGDLELDPRPFVVTVMLAASASFATPISYQTNTLVYGPGNYRFRDFLIVGIPMTIICGFITVLIVPWVWPLSP